MKFHTAQVIRQEEGKSLKVYKDHLGNLTVGIGHKIILADNLWEGDEISEECCMELFMADLKMAEDEAKIIYSDTGGELMVLHVLTCMTFQMGYAGVRLFKKMLAALEENDYAKAADEMLDSTWAREQTPARAQRLADVMRKVSICR